LLSGLLELEAVVAEIDRVNRQAVKVATVGNFDAERFGTVMDRITELSLLAIRFADAARSKADDVRRAAADLMDMWMAMSMRAANQAAAGQPLGEDKAVSFTLAMPVRRMRVALYGEGGDEERQRTWPSGRLSKYYEHGLTASELEVPARDSSTGASYRCVATPAIAQSVSGRSGPAHTPAD
jgi:hypothetical protein